MSGTALAFKMKNKHLFSKAHRLFSSILIAVTFSMSSCETIIDLDLPEHEPAITLNCFFHTDTTITVLIYENRFILDDDLEFDPIENATVSLYSEGSLIGVLSEDSIPARYQLNFYPEAGVAYTITAEKEGFETVEATDIIPGPLAELKIISIEPQLTDYGPEYHLIYSIEDLPGKDYYETRLFKWRHSYDSYYDEEADTVYYYYRGDVLREINYYEVRAELNEFQDIRVNKLFSDELFDSRTREFEIAFGGYPTSVIVKGEPNNEDTGSYVLQVRHVSEDYYMYQTTASLQSEVDGNPLAEPVQVFGNVTNGYGIFAGYHPENRDFEIIHKNGE